MKEATFKEKICLLQNFKEGESKKCHCELCFETGSQTGLEHGCGRD